MFDHDHDRDRDDDSQDFAHPGCGLETIGLFTLYTPEE